MTALLHSGIMEFNADSSLHVGGSMQELTGQVCSKQANASAWGKHDIPPVYKRRSSTERNDVEEQVFPVLKKVKSEPKDDYELAEEECEMNKTLSVSSQSTVLDKEQWKQEPHEQLISPVFERIPSFAAVECHQFNAGAVDINNTLHRRRQIREFEQSGEEPLSNKIRVWKKKRLERSSMSRATEKAGLRMDGENFYSPLKRGEDSEDEKESEGECVVRSRAASRDQAYEHEESGQHEGDVDVEGTGGENSGFKFGYLRYLLTQNGNVGPTIVTNENEVESSRDLSSIRLEKDAMHTVSSLSSMPLVLTSPSTVPQDYMQGGAGKFPILSTAHVQSNGVKVAKAARKPSRHRQGSSFLGRLERGRHDNPTITASKSVRGNKSKLKAFENGVDFQRNSHTDEIRQNISPQLESTHEDEDERGEQYISDIQRPYCNIPDDHQVTHINGVMSLPATRETRYGITLGELKRRTGFPEYLTRVDLIAYVRQSKSAGRALLDKYSISTAGQKSRPTILSKMCENEARVLGDGISRMNTEYFPWKTLARVASGRINEGNDGSGKVEQKLKAIQNTRTMLKEMYDVMVENKDIPCMRTFEVASHTFGTANILNHLTIFDRLFEEYQNNLLFRQNVRRNSHKL